MHINWLAIVGYAVILVATIRWWRSKDRRWSWKQFLLVLLVIAPLTVLVFNWAVHFWR